jgi:hypothetical protein
LSLATPPDANRARHPGTALAPYPGSQRAPAFVTIPCPRSVISRRGPRTG